MTWGGRWEPLHRMGFVENRVVVKNLSVTLFQSVTLQSFSHTNGYLTLYGNM